MKNSNNNQSLTILCLANYVKGEPFLRECHQLGVRTVVLTLEKWKDDPGWPDCVDEMFYIDDLGRNSDLLLAVSYLARERDFSAIVPLDDYAVEIAANLREHLRCPGMGETTARYFRDKLAMRLQARDFGLRVPNFQHVLNYGRLSDFVQTVPGPWLLKPRSEAGSVQIQKLHTPEQMWKAVHGLGDRQSFFLLESYVAGDVYHVDSVVYDSEVLFDTVHRYGRPPFDVWNKGGIFWSQSVPKKDPLNARLLEANRRCIAAMGLPRGVTHAEFIVSHETNDIYFLELAARTAGAHIDVLVEQECGVNLWREWARLEAAYLRGESYKVHPRDAKYGGLLLCLSRQEQPPMDRFSDSAVSWTLAENYHAGLVAVSRDSDKLTRLMGRYHRELEQGILAVAPPTQKPA